MAARRSTARERIGAYEKAVGFGASGEQAEAVRSSFNRGSVEIYSIAQELAC